MSSSLRGGGNPKNRDLQICSPKSRSTSSTEESLSCSRRNQVAEAGLGGKHAGGCVEGSRQNDGQLAAGGGGDPPRGGLRATSLGDPKRACVFQKKELSSPYHPISHHHSKAESKTDFSNLF